MGGDFVAVQSICSVEKSFKYGPLASWQTSIEVVVREKHINMNLQMHGFEDKNQKLKTLVD